MSDVPERDQVDRCFDAAHSMVASREPMTPLEGTILAAARGVVYALEGVAHQVRDADNTVAMLLTPTIHQSLADLTIATGGDVSTPIE